MLFLLREYEYSAMQYTPVDYIAIRTQEPKLYYYFPFPLLLLLTSQYGSGQQLVQKHRAWFLRGQAVLRHGDIKVAEVFAPGLNHELKCASRDAK